MHLAVKYIVFSRQFCSLLLLKSGGPIIASGTAGSRNQARKLLASNRIKKSVRRRGNHRPLKISGGSNLLASIRHGVAMFPHRLLLIGALIIPLSCVQAQASQCKVSSSELLLALASSTAWLEQRDALVEGSVVSIIEREIAILLAHEQLPCRELSTHEVQALSIRAIEARLALSRQDLSWLAPLTWLALQYCPVKCESRKLQGSLREVVAGESVLDPLETTWIFGLGGLGEQGPPTAVCNGVLRNAVEHAGVYSEFRAYAYAITHSVFALTQFGKKQSNGSNRECVALLSTPTRIILERSKLTGDLDLYAEAIAASSYLGLSGIDWSAMATALLAHQQYDGSFLPPILYGPDFAYEHYHATAAATLALASLNRSLSADGSCWCGRSCGDEVENRQFDPIHNFYESEQRATKYEPSGLNLSIDMTSHLVSTLEYRSRPWN